MTNNTDIENALTKGATTVVTPAPSHTPPSQPMADLDFGVDGLATVDYHKSGSPMRSKRRPSDMYALPLDSPVQVLGKHNGICYYCDPEGELRPLMARDHSVFNITELFGTRTDWLSEAFPKWTLFKKDDREFYKITPPKFESSDAAICLMTTAATKGNWNPQDKERGVGAYLAKSKDFSNLIIHQGNKLLLVSKGKVKEQKIGLYQNCFYSGTEGHGAPIMNDFSGIEEMFKAIKTWNFARTTSDIDARIMIGWIAQAFIGGALPWRGMLWLTGDKGTGKSEIGFLAQYAVGDKRMLTNSTGGSVAGITQNMGKARLPVKLDDFVNKLKQGDDKLSKILEVIKVSHTGDVMRLGGQDGRGKEYSLFSPFLCSTVYLPSEVEGEIRSRFVEVRLNPIENKSDTMPYTDEKAELWGRQAFGKILSRWGDFDEVLSVWRQRLIELGANSRQANVMGPILACSDMILLNAPRDSWTGINEGLQELIEDEKEQDIADYKKILNVIGNHIIKEGQVGGKYNSVNNLITTFFDGGMQTDKALLLKIKDLLSAQGMAIVEKEIIATDLHGAIPCIAFPVNGNAAIGEAFMGTPWYGMKGARGPWFAALERAPCVVRGSGNTFREYINSKQCAALYIPIHMFLDSDPRDLKKRQPTFEGL